MKMFFSDEMVKELRIELFYEQDIVKTMKNGRNEEAGAEYADIRIQVNNAQRYCADHSVPCGNSEFVAQFGYQIYRRKKNKRQNWWMRSLTTHISQASFSCLKRASKQGSGC